jgi:hypothetical protein
MKTLARCGGVVLTTVLLTVGLLSIDPFEQVSRVLDAAFGAAPSWTQVSNLNVDPSIQEVSHGDHPLDSLEHLAAYWHERPDAPKVVLVGNSQMLEMSLAPQERPQLGAERTYPDLVAAHFASRGVLTYRLAAPGMSYSEALWYLHYLLVNPALRPSAFVLQVNYQALWNGNIRDSLLELLADAAFRARIGQETQSGQPYAVDFSNALAQFDARTARAASAEKPAGGHGFGPAVEDAVRSRLETVPVFRARSAEKASFDRMLYRARLYFLRIKPSNARSISGPRLDKSQAALDAIADLCGRTQVRLVLFTAPLNPRVSLYASSEDRERFETFVHGLAAKHHLRLFDLERAVAAELWGRQFNSPDPLHMGRTAHRHMADEIVAAVNAALRKIS